MTTYLRLHGARTGESCLIEPDTIMMVGRDSDRPTTTNIIFAIGTTPFRMEVIESPSDIETLLADTKKGTIGYIDGVRERYASQFAQIEAEKE